MEKKYEMSINIALDGKFAIYISKTPLRENIV